MGAIGITLLMLLGIAGFGALAWRKLAIVQALARSTASATCRPGCAACCATACMQQRMVQREWRPGLMHAVIFLGFMSLLVRKVQLLAIGYSETFVWPDAFGGPFAAFKDGVEVAVTLAVLYGFYRRFVLHPKRLEPNREAILVLGLILAIMLTDFAFDGFSFALLRPACPALHTRRSTPGPATRWRRCLSACRPGALQAGYVLSYWTQMVVVFSFLVLLPAGEHFHIVTALPTLFFRRGRPGHRVPSVDMEKLMEATEEADMVAGARRPHAT
jgi:hypothetical protein